ncbi:excalibur calcium-binding domain-containing protein [Acinetobacter ursingii]|uniref:excalibur calcium-binding domain-containing protein n=1 Tax=Acinetobacter ursingii TaxID=108980 RepID=UPI003AF90917
MKYYIFSFIAVLIIMPTTAIAKKCADFKTQQEAQSWFEKQRKSGGSGWKGLDRDGDGKACDCLPGGNGKNCPKSKK